MKPIQIIDIQIVKLDNGRGARWHWIVDYSDGTTHCSPGHIARECAVISLLQETVESILKKHEGEPSMIMRIDYEFEFMGSIFSAQGVDIGETTDPDWHTQDHRWGAVFHALPELCLHFENIHEAYTELNSDSLGFHFAYCEKSPE